MCAFSWQKTQSFVLSTHSIGLAVLPSKSPELHMPLWSCHELCEPQSVSSVPPSVQRTSHFLFSHNQLHTISSWDFLHCVLISFCKTELFCFFFFPHLFSCLLLFTVLFFRKLVFQFTLPTKKLFFCFFFSHFYRHLLSLLHSSFLVVIKTS